MNNPKIAIAGSKEDVLKGLEVLKNRYGGNTPLIEVIKYLDKNNG